MVFLYFRYTWMILKLPDNIIYSFVTCRLPRHNLLLIPRYSAIVSNYDLNVLATFLSLETTLSPSIRVILSLSSNVLERKGFTVFQNYLLSVIFLTLRLLKSVKYSFVCCKLVYITEILSLEISCVTSSGSLQLFSFFSYKGKLFISSSFFFEGANLFKSLRDIA